MVVVIRPFRMVMYILILQLLQLQPQICSAMLLVIVALLPRSSAGLLRGAAFACGLLVFGLSCLMAARWNGQAAMLAVHASLRAACQAGDQPEKEDRRSFN